MTEPSPLLAGPWPSLATVACAAALASGCVRRQQTLEDPVAPLLLAADEAWAERDRVGLEAAEEPLQEAYGLDPHRPEVLWRLVRHQHALGWTEPTDRARLFAWAEGRSMGLDCLATDPEVDSLRLTRGWVAALAAVDTPATEPCVAWTAMVWSRWIALLGAGATAVDLPTVRALADRAAGAEAADRALNGRWSQALLDATAPRWAGGDPTEALATLEVLVQHHPSELLLQVDRLRVTGDILTPPYRAKLLEELKRATPDTPEERAAIAALLEAEGAKPGPQGGSPR